MTTTPKPSPLLKAAPLWQKSSAKGGQYLTGRLGGMKVLVMENRDRRNDDDPSHHLFFAEAPPRQGAQERGEGRRAGADVPQAAQRPPAAYRTSFQGHSGGGDGDMPPWER